MNVPKYQMSGKKDSLLIWNDEGLKAYNLEK